MPAENDAQQNGPELRTYTVDRNGTEMQVQLTEEQAQRQGAKPVDDSDDQQNAQTSGAEQTSTKSDSSTVRNRARRTER